ncbi:MAG: hypothetical protein PVH84_16190 [Candidatus Aminicenantes bacterium]|jgi:hypothetical protein
MEDKLEKSLEELLKNVQGILAILKEKEIPLETKKPEYPGEFPENNVHRLLRIVWVYVKNSVWDQNTSVYDPNELEADIDPAKFKIEAIDALEKLYGVLAEPWKKVSNPCEGAWPRRIRG